MKANRFLFVLLFFPLLFSCKKKMNMNEFASWVESGQYPHIYSKSIAGYTFQLKYIPSDYMAIKNLIDNDIAVDSFTDLRKKFSNAQYMILRISRNDHKDLLKVISENQQEYTQMVNYFSFEMGDKIYAINGHDTLNSSFFHYERNYSLSPYNTFIVEFENHAIEDSLNKDDLVFVLEDDQLSVGTVKIVIPKKDIASIPEIIL